MQSVHRNSAAILQSDPELLIGNAGVARFFGIHERCVGELRKAGFPSVRVGHHLISTRRMALAWLEKRMEGGGDG